MPRIDPERLLRTLAPLLEPLSGAIKSVKEVDKIYGLMSKFSKKLVSKCTYINILKASKPEVLDLFFQRGGWDMVHGWTVDACDKRNNELLKEIGHLLLYAPASVQRLKENDLPKLVKNISKDCENEELREIAKQVVTKWVSIAKQQENPIQTSKVTVGSDLQSQSVGVVVDPIPSSVNPPTYAKQENNGVENEVATGGDFDISGINISELMEFNPEEFSTVMDQHFTGTDPNTVVNNETSNSNVSTTPDQTVVPNTLQTVNYHQITSESVNGPSNNIVSKLTIKTVDGKKAVVQGVNQEKEAPYCIMLKDGKPFLVRLKLATPNEINKLSLQTPNVNEVQGVVGDEKKKRPRKDPTVAASRNIQLSTTDEKHKPNILKTYSSKTPVVPLTTEKEKTEGQVDKIKSSEKVSKSSSSDKKSGSSIKKHRSGSSSKSGAAAAAKKQAEDTKLKEKIKQEKLTLKNRHKEVAKQKQQEKDQETLKKLNLSEASNTNTSPSSMKIPKIPKRTSSFADAIGIPGTLDNSTLLAEKSSKSSKVLSRTQSQESIPEQVATKFYGKKEEDVTKKNEDRRHRVKVFQSKKSRADDLLKDMTENVKSNKTNKSDHGVENDSGLTGEKSLAKTNLGLKPEKRPSIDGIEKPGDIKKQKLSLEEKSEKNKDKESKSSLKEKDTSKGVKVIKESSLFMDALSASTDTPKEKKRKRRLSSSNEKDKNLNISKSSSRNNVAVKESPTEENPPGEPSPVANPVFNFYRDTLADSDTLPQQKSAELKSSETEENIMEVDDDDPVLIDDPFTSLEGECKLKSALVILRPKNKPKKKVQWREDDEIKEIYTFELDETERVNVTRINHPGNDFKSMKDLEKAEEKELISKNLKRRILGGEDIEEKMPWRKPVPILLDMEFPPITSEEKAVQEDRERINLGVFLPPGSLLPDSPAEPEPLSPNSSEDRLEPRVIPMEDVLNVTKVFDKMRCIWPNPVGTTLKQNQSHPTPGVDAAPFGLPNFGMNHPPDMNVNPSLTVPGFPNIPNHQIDFNNPWNIAGVPPPNGIPGMPSFPPNAMNMMGPPPHGFPNIHPPNPFGFPVPNFPPPGMGFPPPPNNQNAMIPNNNSNMNRGGDLNRGGLHNANRGRGGNSGRDFGDRDHRRTYRDEREQDSRSSRGNFDSRGRSRDYRSRDRDRRSPSPVRSRRRDERDKDRHTRDDKDYRDHDYRSRGRSGKSDIPCRYFKKGYCHSGTRCEFSHSDTPNDSSSTDRPPRHSSPKEKHSSPPVEDSGSLSPTSASVSISSQFERRPSRDENAATNFTDAPSSPMNEIQEDPSLLLQSGISEPAKIIPVE